MSFTIDSQNPRTIKALTIAAGASSWLKCTARDGRAIIGVPSQCKPGAFYLVDPIGQICDCQDAKRNPRIACKHVLAVRLHQELAKAQPPKAVTIIAPARIAERRPVLTMVRHGDDEVTWERTSDVERAARYDRIFGTDEAF